MGDIKRLAIAIHELQATNPTPLSNWQHMHSGEDSASYRSSNNGTRVRKRRHRRSASDSSDMNTIGSELSDEEDHSEASHKQVYVLFLHFLENFFLMYIIHCSKFPFLYRHSASVQY